MPVPKDLATCWTNMVHLYSEASCRCKEVIKNYLELRYHTKKHPLNFNWGWIPISCALRSLFVYGIFFVAFKIVIFLGRLAMVVSASAARGLCKILTKTLKQFGGNSRNWTNSRWAEIKLATTIKRINSHHTGIINYFFTKI